MATSNVRVAGSGYTWLAFNGKRIEYLRSISDQGQLPVAQAEAVQGIGDDYPVEIAFPNAIGGGTLSFTSYELWGKGVWQTVFNDRFGDANDLLQVFRKQLNLGNIQIQKMVRGPSGKGRVETYMNCVVTNISDAENVALNTMTQPKQITVMYTRKIISAIA